MCGHNIIYDMSYFTDKHDGHVIKLFNSFFFSIENFRIQKMLFAVYLRYNLNIVP